MRRTTPQKAKPPSKPPQKTVRIQNLSKIIDSIHADFDSSLSKSKPSEDSKPWFSPEGIVLFTNIAAQYNHITSLLKRQGLSPSALTPPSQKAYRWLQYLNEPAQFRLHLEGLIRLHSLVHSVGNRKSTLFRRQPQVHIRLDNISALYRSRQVRGQIELVIHEGYAGAPAEVLEALVWSALVRKTRLRSKALRDYTAGQSFITILNQLDPGGIQAGTNPQGNVYHLDDVFERVNAAYFSGNLPKPNLTWNRRLTYRTFGHYQSDRDTVMLSKTLDNAAVPAYVLDYVMYHELLHKKLEVKAINGRKYAHTPEFRGAERQFHQYEKAKAFLTQISSRPL